MERLKKWTIYAAPKGRPKAWRKRAEHWREEQAMQFAWGLICAGQSVRVTVTDEEPVNRWD